MQSKDFGNSTGTERIYDHSLASSPLQRCCKNYFIVYGLLTQPPLRAIRGAASARPRFHARSLLCYEIILTASRQLRKSSFVGIYPRCSLTLWMNSITWINGIFAYYIYVIVIDVINYL